MKTPVAAATPRRPDHGPGTDQPAERALASGTLAAAGASRRLPQPGQFLADLPQPPGQLGVVGTPGGPPGGWPGSAAQVVPEEEASHTAVAAPSSGERMNGRARGVSRRMTGP